MDNCNITDNCLATAAFYDLDFPQYQIPPMPDSMIFTTYFERDPTQLTFFSRPSS